MRYIRFLKPPRIETKKFRKLSCLITITSDLGDSFLPYDLPLTAELCSFESGPHGKRVVFAQAEVDWTAGMRDLAIALPLDKTNVTWPARVRIGIRGAPAIDEYEALCAGGTCGVLSAWSAHLDASEGINEAARFVQRQIRPVASGDHGYVIRMWEETGESIACHLWYILQIYFWLKFVKSFPGMPALPCPATCIAS
jgi:hypothetical protein